MAIMHRNETMNPFLSAAAILIGTLPFGVSAAGEPFDALRTKARDLAAKPYAPRPGQLDDFWAKLNYDQHRDIRFKKESGLW